MTAPKMKIKKGDTVVVITGKDKGRTGEVTKVIPAEARVVVAGINQMTKHRKPTQFAQGGIEKVEASIHVSNVALADPKSGKATKVGFKAEKDGTKVRIARKSGEKIG
ncbi:MAG: 50S ribosomal protein L24 [Micavibrio aeruginosavorus]|uniref:Large ribosomal subunit protein uL24 n=1 Tax=Micavibrio aeruginosavorus TaxID=349221 RepID=A0A2W5FRE9_9BACT|nr:MAG: 50S ribosomal protein L24 [Micavibrio aeruginosavorus]